MNKVLRVQRRRKQKTLKKRLSFSYTNLLFSLCLNQSVHDILGVLQSLGDIDSASEHDIIEGMFGSFTRFIDIGDDLRFRGQENLTEKTEEKEMRIMRVMN
jgi:hypothetical protein